MRTRWITAILLTFMLVAGPLAPVLAQDGARPYIGISFQEQADGALIMEVMPGSPAEAAGLLPGDLITALDGTPLSLETSLVSLLEGYAPGDAITLAVERAGATVEIVLTLGTRPAEDAFPTGEPSEEEGPLRRHISVAGAVFVDLGTRWHVVEIAPGSAAAEAGLAPGDMVTAIDGHPLETYDSGLLATRAAEGGELPLVVLRGGETRELTLLLAPGTPVETTVRRSPAIPEQAESIPLPAIPPIPQAEEAKGYLGVAYVMLNAEMLEALAADETRPFEMPATDDGALIIGVQAGGPAAEAGIVMGDVILEINNDRVDEERTLADRIYAYEEGDIVTLTVLRGTEMLGITVTLVARPPMLGQSPIPAMPPEADLFAPFADPDFDLDGFLEANPDFLDELREQGFAGLLGPFFSSPNFDWGAFLTAHPGFMALLEHLAGEYAPEELERLFPEFPWFGEYDPFHEDMDPRMPSDSDNNPA
ncbi:MAG: PDZ domain-containing protein [Anaerolineae bacterium]|nr:PDZ domain-containing protein [Anaerolineae bacterium]